MSSVKTKRLAGISLCHFTSDAPWFLLSAVLPVVIKDFGLSYGGAGASVTTMIVSMILFQTLIGFLTKGQGKSIQLFAGSITIGCALLLVSFSTSPVQFLLLQVMAGFGMAFYHPIGYTMISKEYSSSGLGKAFGINESAGIAAAPIIFASSGILLLYFSWHMIFRIWAVITLSSAFAVLFILKEKRASTTIELIKKEERRSVFQWNIIRKLSLLIFLMILSEICSSSLTAFTPTFLASKGLSVGYANAISAGMMSIGIIGTFVIGSSLDRYGERRVILFTTSTILITSIIIFALDEVQYIIPLVFIMGFPLLGMGPPYYSLISRKTELKDQTSAYAVVLSMAWGIGGLFPYLEGALSDIFGINTIFLVVAVSALVSIIISYFWVRASPG